ncbi:hypothetical protein [uncultured Parabacteroides sp.]|uniref:hypothetical protein n=1 Tax=uncultured Parabacteroides sp. TaxID=512312 RepID=UPI002624E356|nr:hypothetical protein [uncultured Parabacteroides sp.]
MKVLKYIIILIICLSFISVNAQLSTNELPYSFRSENQYLLQQRNIVTIESYEVLLPKTELELSIEDSIDNKNGLAPRFAYPIPVNRDMNNSGNWRILENGDKLWQMEIYSPGALSIHLLYDKFWIPEGASLFLYSKDRKQYMGAFTSINNKGDSINVRGFITDLINSDRIILEYYQPAEVVESAIISIEAVLHGYKNVTLNTPQNAGFGQSGNCEVNINCSEGANWQTEKRAVTMILADGRSGCSGALINTMARDGRPLLLTANHCLTIDRRTGDGYYKVYDAVSSPNLDQYIFYWNYESSSCSGGNEPVKRSTVGATVLANNSNTDFALLLLAEDPKLLSGYDTYYLGWDRTSNPGSGGVCIHHPMFDIKKISTHNMIPESYNSSFWGVYWQQTSNGYGVTEFGSSGSPLLTSNGHRIIGQLFGMPYYADCNSPDNVYSEYGKFHVSWDNGNIAERRLKDWLDPENTGVMNIEGLSASANSFNVNGTIYQSNCQQVGYSGIKFYSWGGAYKVCRNQEVLIRFKSNKTNLSCTVWSGQGPCIMRTLSDGSYEVTCTPESEIFELCFTSGSINEYISLESNSNSYTMTYDNASGLILIELKEDVINTRMKNLYNIFIYDQMGAIKKKVKMDSNMISISTLNLTNGIYFIHIMDNTGQKIGSKKISVSR